MSLLTFSRSFARSGVAYTRAFSTVYPKKKIEGQPIPDVTFKTRVDGQWKELKLKDHLKSKKAILFGLPGAFTPTCSSTHLPGYAAKAADFKKLGVDEILCLSVNDAFVMNAWGKDLKIDPKTVTLLPDGNLDFTKAVGMDTDKKAIGFGERSWRYSMFIDNGTIKKVFAEPAKEGDPFEVSDAETMLAYLKVNK